MKTPFLISAIALLLFTIAGCNQESEHQKKIRELIQTEHLFSALSVEQGAHKAFLAYIDDSCTLLRPNRYPVVGKDKIKELFDEPDTSYVLSWEPLFANIARSGELGYTYGIYKVEMDSPEGQQVTKEGTYLTIWRKNRKGEWKFVLDTGNQGLGRNEKEIAYQ